LSSVSSNPYASQTIFTGDAKFTGVEFAGEAGFDGAIFAGEAWFTGVNGLVTRLLLIAAIVISATGCRPSHNSAGVSVT
jgi:hypothetical protein